MTKVPYSREYSSLDLSPIGLRLCRYRFYGPVVYFNLEPGPNPLIAPITVLLEAQPHLLHEPMSPRNWAPLINSAMPAGLHDHEYFNGNGVAWHFRNHEKLFVEQFGMVSI